MTTQVKIIHTLLGRTGRGKKEIDDRTNSEKLDGVLKVIKNQFGDRPVYVLDGNLVIDDTRKYPHFFAAGWFLSEDKTSELVVVGHGSTLANAREYLMNSVKGIDWESLSRNV